MSAIGMKLTNSKGYYIIPGTNTYPDIFLIFTNVKNIDKKYDELVLLRNKYKKNNTKKNKDILKLKNIKRKTKKHNINNKITNL